MRYYAIQDIPSGDEILMPYGKFKRHSNAELLLDYGYVRTSNKDDLGCVHNPYYRRDFTHSAEKKQLLDSLDLWRYVYYDNY